MAVKVRVQNFQSIEDETVVIDGMTVVTGTNNCGKTSLMRAIRGVFTNAPAGPLVRHGTAYLTVTITFGDGTEVEWKKGWSKPNRKGKAVNAYAINGKELNNVGRGVPPEVEALGVREVSASSDRLWPQIAQQFAGTLFLVNRPGSAVAEALSDVERVGKLTSALKASEKDRRAVVSELKVRRADVVSHKGRVATYDGLDGVGSEVEALGAAMKEITSLHQKRQEAERYRDRRATAVGALDALAGFNPDAVPSGERAEKLCAAKVRVRGFQDRLDKARGGLQSLVGFVSPTLPESAPVSDLRDQLREASALGARLHTARDAVDSLNGYSALDLPDPTRIERVQKAIHKIRELSSTLQEKRGLIEALGSTRDRLERELKEAEEEVTRLLGDRGVCPTCNTVHGDSAHV